MRSRSSRCATPGRSSLVGAAASAVDRLAITLHFATEHKPLFSGDSRRPARMAQNGANQPGRQDVQQPWFGNTPSSQFASQPLACEPHARSIRDWRSEEHTSELQSRSDLVCRLLLEKKK